MFFFVMISKHVRVPPEFLGPNMFDYVNQKLNEMMGSCTVQYGYLLTIYNVEAIENGVVNQFGEALFTVRFKALVFRPLKGEVLDGVVEGIERVGIEVGIGGFRVFIPHTKIPERMQYNSKTERFEGKEEGSQ